MAENENGSEKTEKATDKRLTQVRDKGQVSKSQDLTSAVILTVGFFMLFSTAPKIMQQLESITIYTFSHLNPDTINPQNIIGIFKPYFGIMMNLLLPFFLIMAATSYLSVRLQIGNIFVPNKLMPDFSKLSPMSMVGSFKSMFNIFSLQKIVELGKSLLKMAVVAIFVFNVIVQRRGDLLSLLGADMNLSFATISSILHQIALNMCIILLIIGIMDKKFQDFEYDKSLKMTKEEVKDERKNAEGDPKIKAKIKQIQRQMAQQRMMASIPTADVIVTNPTHYAVALRYDLQKAVAPQVVAKGVDFLAFKIKEIAKNNNVPIVENKPLARTLYKIVPLDSVIPAELYVAVAEVLAFVFKANKNRRT